MVTILRALAKMPHELSMNQIIFHFADSDGGKAKLYIDELVQSKIINKRSGYYSLPHEIRKMVLSDS